jgi:hypothetical protein
LSHNGHGKAFEVTTAEALIAFTLTQLPDFGGQRGLRAAESLGFR